VRQAIIACRKGGTVSLPGADGGFLDKIPFGAVVSKALTIKSDQSGNMVVTDFPTRERFLGEPSK